MFGGLARGTGAFYCVCVCVCAYQEQSSVDYTVVGFLVCVGVGTHACVSLFLL